MEGKKVGGRQRLQMKQINSFICDIIAWVVMVETFN